MLALRGRSPKFLANPNGVDHLVARVVTAPDAEPGTADAYLVKGETIPPGFPYYIAHPNDVRHLDHAPDDAVRFALPEKFEYLAAGDVLGVHTASGRVRTLYRRNSRNNSFLVTERCNSYCLMCSQPPKNVNDDWIVDEILEALPLLDQSTQEIGFTGGEPTLLGDRFLKVLRRCKELLPETAVHVLSNGRNFSDPALARAWADIAHPDLMVGIPLYSDISDRHDYVVQADGAYDETLRGILNLKRERQRVEVRVVLHKQTFSGLPRLAEFLARNLLFVDHVALMGLEMMGFTRANLEAPLDRSSRLSTAAQGSRKDAFGLRHARFYIQPPAVSSRHRTMAVRCPIDQRLEERVFSRV